MTAHPAIQREGDGRDPLACSSLDAALFLAALALATQYTVALARIGQESMWGAVHPAVFWVGLLGSPLAALVPAWLLGRFSRVNTVWPAVGLAAPLIVWSVGLWEEPRALLLVGGAALLTLATGILPARQGRKKRLGSEQRRNLCPACGYCLSGLGADAGRVSCPECGRPAPSG